MNTLGYKLYEVIGEANSKAIPLAFMFTTHDKTTDSGAKDLLLWDLLQFIKTQCLNIVFTLSDKDMSEINACQSELPDVKHQLCYWHAICYIENFIDPTWAPGVTLGWLEEGVHEADVEAECLAEPLKIKIDPKVLKGNLVATKTVKEDESDAKIAQLEAELKDLKYGAAPMEKVPVTTTIDQAQVNKIVQSSKWISTCYICQEKTCCPPLFILKHGNKQIKFWLSLPAMKGLKDLPPFCPSEHQSPIIELFRHYLHLHESIPIDESGTK
ncbi:hypothetical protein WG66_001468 [Moniliophthora roreri]|nr:hypothetical protein WG66_001468 [Moniliophthora roreri]